LNYPVIRNDLVRVHAENAAHLARQRMLLTEAPHARLADIHETDQRLGGNFRYLKLVGAGAVDMAAEAFATTPEIGEAVVYAALSMHAKQIDFAEVVLGQMESEEAAISALAEAFRHVEREAQRSTFYAWIGHENPALVSAALAAATLLRLNLKDLLAPLTTDARPLVQASALEHAGVMGLVQFAPTALSALGHADAGLAFAAAVASIRLGHPRAAQRLVESITPDLAPAKCRLAVEVGFPALAEEGAHQKVRALLGDEATQRWGLLALGMIGSVRTLPYLLRQMEQLETMRMAGWAFAMITGVNIAEDDLELDEFPQCEDDPLLEGAAEELFFEDGLPFPDVRRVTDWLKANGSKLTAEHALLFGLPQWTWQEMESPDLEFQARYRALAQVICVRQADRRLPNWQAPVRLTGGKLARDWQM
jgi:uncharacterized protein (TIGR02270 family)